MKLIEALEIVNSTSSVDPRSTGKCVFLASGIMPLHLATFLHAHVKLLFPGHPVALEVGVFGDVVGNIRRAAEQSPHAVAIALEWSDLDPRLGLRVCGGWGAGLHGDIVQVAAATLERVEQEIRNVSRVCPVVLSLPTLPLPPIAYTPGWQSGLVDLQLSELCARFAVRIAELPRASVVSGPRLSLLSPVSERLDVKADLARGFPYRQQHANALASMMASLIRAAEPKKGLITDLDDTLWRGILGDAGVAAVCWDLASNAQVHGLYQQFLMSLAQSGVLIGIASKNEPALVEQVFLRSDLLVRRDQIFPIEASWGAKSAAVTRILGRWNIGADAVVFVDDSRLEVEEVRAAHPAMECIHFPKSDPQAVYELLWLLRDRFGKVELQDEDRIRLTSLRNAEHFQTASVGQASTPDAFLGALDARVTLEFTRDASDARALELVNKTNQFNLNGIRYTAADWQAALDRDNAFLLTVSYEDKFGPLGKIGVLMGTVEPTGIMAEQWVMSCRAFSRRIEHQVIHSLFQQLGKDRIDFSFRRTERNGPLREFFSEFLEMVEEEGTFALIAFDFQKKCPSLYHHVSIVSGIGGSVEAAHGR